MSVVYYTPHNIETFDSITITQVVTVLGFAHEFEATIAMCNLMSRQSKPPLKKKGVEPLAAAVDPPTIIEPNKFDVLCGKSRECVSFEGTRRFRQLIEQYRVIYQDAKNKQERMEITKEIVSSVGQTGRFLKFNRRLQAWEVSISFWRKCFVVL